MKSARQRRRRAEEAAGRGVGQRRRAEAAGALNDGDVTHRDAGMIAGDQVCLLGPAQTPRPELLDVAATILLGHAALVWQPHKK